LSKREREREHMQDVENKIVVFIFSKAIIRKKALKILVLFSPIGPYRRPCSRRG
jgi:hypothetical protein